MRSRTPITFIVELFVSLANSCHKELPLADVAGVHAALLESLSLGHDQYHFILFLYIIYYVGCFTVNKVGSLNPVKFPVGFEPKPSDSIIKS